MPRRTVALCVLALGCGAPPGRPAEPVTTATPEPAQTTALDPSSATSVAEHLRLPDTESPRRDDYADAVAQGHVILLAFADEHGWAAHAREPSFDSVEVFATREALWRAVLVLYDAPSDTEMPGTGPVAGIEGRILLSVTEAEYARAHPEYAAGPDAMARLYAHEMVHRLHVRVLGGHDDAMGPRWFFEGLAVIGSGQDYDVGHVTYANAEEALAGAHDGLEPALAYRRYAAALRYFLRRHELRELVERAGDEDFEGWLSETGG